MRVNIPTKNDQACIVLQQGDVGELLSSLNKQLKQAKSQVRKESARLFEAMYLMSKELLVIFSANIIWHSELDRLKAKKKIDQEHVPKIKEVMMKISFVQTDMKHVIGTLHHFLAFEHIYKEKHKRAEGGKLDVLDQKILEKISAQPFGLNFLMIAEMTVPLVAGLEEKIEEYNASLCIVPTVEKSKDVSDKSQNTAVHAQGAALGALSIFASGCGAGVSDKVDKPKVSVSDFAP